MAGNEALQPHQQRGEKSDNQCSPSFQGRKRREEQLCLSHLLREGTELFHAVFTTTQILEGTPSYCHVCFPEAIPNPPAAGSQCSQCPCAGPWSWPHSQCGHARVLGLFRGLGCPVLSPFLLRFQAGRASPCSHRTVSSHEAGNRDTQRDTAPAPQSNRTGVFGVGISKADRDGFRVLSLGGYPGWKGISGSQHSLRLEGKEKQGTWRRGIGDQDQQSSHLDNSPSSSPKHWGGEGLEVDLAL